VSATVALCTPKKFEVILRRLYKHRGVFQVVAAMQCRVRNAVGPLGSRRPEVWRDTVRRAVRVRSTEVAFSAREIRCQS
jgi:hypothetical protein